MIARERATPTVWRNPNPKSKIAAVVARATPDSVFALFRGLTHHG